MGTNIDHAIGYDRRRAHQVHAFIARQHISTLGIKSENVAVCCAYINYAVSY